jgi:hypothetical protein
MAKFRVFFRGELSDESKAAFRRPGAAVYSGFVDLNASDERAAKAAFSSATRADRGSVSATAVRAG